MLANGTTLGYKEKGASGNTYTNLPGLKEIPDIGTDPEKVDNTVLTDKNKTYENGIGNLPDMVYKFRYENKNATSPFRVMREYAKNGKALSFEETSPDGTKIHYDAQVSVKRTAGGVNAAVGFDLGMTVQSDIEYVDPA